MCRYRDGDVAVLSERPYPSFRRTLTVRSCSEGSLCVLLTSGEIRRKPAGSRQREVVMLVIIMVMVGMTAV